MMKWDEGPPSTQNGTAGRCASAVPHQTGGNYRMACNGLNFPQNSCGFDSSCIWTLLIIALIILWLSNGFGCGCSDC